MKMKQLETTQSFLTSNKLLYRLHKSVHIKQTEQKYKIQTQAIHYKYTMADSTSYLKRIYRYVTGTVTNDNEAEESISNKRQKPNTDDVIVTRGDASSRSAGATKSTPTVAGGATVRSASASSRRRTHQPLRHTTSKLSTSSRRPSISSNYCGGGSSGAYYPSPYRTAKSTAAVYKPRVPIIRSTQPYRSKLLTATATQSAPLSRRKEWLFDEELIRDITVKNKQSEKDASEKQYLKEQQTPSSNYPAPASFGSSSTLKQSSTSSSGVTGTSGAVASTSTPAFSFGSALAPPSEFDFARERPDLEFDEIVENDITFTVS